MAQAWLDAARDLGIRVEHPFHFRAPDGSTVTTQGVYLPDFGSERGVLLTCRFDADTVCDAADQTDYYQSGLNPRAYEPYRRALYVETLNDWGWFGDEASAPDWFAGSLRRHGGAA